jgi:hypothetical protein
MRSTCLYAVDLDFDEVRTLLTGADAADRPVDDAELFSWLLSHGFFATRDGWKASADGLNRLSHRAIRFCQRVGA